MVSRPLLDLKNLDFAAEGCYFSKNSKKNTEFPKTSKFSEKVLPVKKNAKPRHPKSHPKPKKNQSDSLKTVAEFS